MNLVRRVKNWFLCRKYGTCEACRGPGPLEDPITRATRYAERDGVELRIIAGLRISALRRQAVCRACADQLTWHMRDADQWADEHGVKAPGEQEMVDFIVQTIERARASRR